MNKLTTKISIVESNAEGLFILFEIKNNTKDELYVLKRNTPLEGLKTDCLRVTLNDKPIAYDGYLVKRTYPKLDEYLKISPAETASNVINVSKGYDTSKPGKYKIEFNEANLVVLPGLPAPSAFMQFKAMSISLDIRVSNQPVNINQTTKTALLTVGQLHRGAFKKKIIKSVSALKKGFPTPIVVDATPAQKKDILKAHRDAIKYSKKSKSSITANKLYETWFGKYTAARAKKVDTVFSEIITKLETITFTYIVGGDECDDSTVAYTTTGGSTIWLCESFWEMPAGGFESKAGTLVHEHSHASGGTDDFEYYNAECRVLAAKTPAKAVKNADNYEYFSESLFKI